MEQGIGVQLAIEPQHQLRRFLKDLPQHLGNSFEAEDVHVTIVYPEEIARAALGTEERRKLPSVANKISERVGELSLEGISLNIVPNVIRPFKKFLGVEIVDEEDSSICDNVRWAASTEIEAGLGIKLRSYLPSYHASIARRPPGNGTEKVIRYSRHFPSDFVIAGYNAGVRTVATGNGHIENYINDSLRCDPNRKYS